MYFEICTCIPARSSRFKDQDHFPVIVSTVEVTDLSKQYFRISYNIHHTVMLENTARIILCDLNEIAHLHIVCDFNLSDDSQG